MPLADLCHIVPLAESVSSDMATVVALTSVEDFTKCRSCNPYDKTM